VNRNGTVLLATHVITCSLHLALHERQLCQPEASPVFTLRVKNRPIYLPTWRALHKKLGKAVMANTEISSKQWPVLLLPRAKQIISSRHNNNTNNNPWRYSSDEPWPAEQPPLAVFPDCIRRYWVDMWLAHRIPQLHFQLSKPDRYLFIQVTTQFIRSRGWVEPVPDPTPSEKS
jgi:hypothetical protein